MISWRMRSRTTLLSVLLFAVSPASNAGSDSTGSQQLLITCDFGCIRKCTTVDEVVAVAHTLISALPDIVAMDATANGLVNYTSEIGFLVPGSNFEALMKAGLEPFGMMVDTLRRHGITALANVRMNDHHGIPLQDPILEGESESQSKSLPA